MTVTSTGNIATGSDSQGILAQNFAILAVGPITVTSLGNVAATGTNSVGIMANSFGNASGNISVNVLGGTVTGGNGSGIGVELIDGACGVLQTHQRRGPLGRRLLGFRGHPSFCAVSKPSPGLSRFHPLLNPLKTPLWFSPHNPLLTHRPPDPLAPPPFTASRNDAIVSHYARASPPPTD